MPPPPIALASLSIRDFRGIENLDLDFRGPDGLPNQLVVLAGPNGSGKTAVLEAALIAVGGSKLISGRSGKAAIRRGAEDYTIDAKIRDSTQLDDSEQPLPTNTSRGSTKPRVPHWYFSSWRTPILVGPIDVTVGKPGRRPAKTDANRLLNVKQQLVNAAAVERFKEGQRSLMPRYSEWIGLINRAWWEFDTNTKGKFYVGLAEAEFEEGGSFELFYEAEGRMSLAVDNLSAGQLELFLFLAALALNDDRKGLVFIDEPELHLDPQWHASIVRSLMRLQPNAQFIVSTHSPKIYDSAMSYERHFLVPEDDPRAMIWGRARAGV
jgi:predicted ATPase